jgi:hypothetical protein
MGEEWRVVRDVSQHWFLISTSVLWGQFWTYENAFRAQYVAHHFWHVAEQFVSCIAVVGDSWQRFRKKSFVQDIETDCQCCNEQQCYRVRVWDIQHACWRYEVWDVRWPNSALCCVPRINLVFTCSSSFLARITPHCCCIIKVAQISFTCMSDAKCKLAVPVQHYYPL